MWLVDTLDAVALSYSTFFVGLPTFALSSTPPVLSSLLSSRVVSPSQIMTAWPTPRISNLWLLYFTSRPQRTLFYIGHCILNCIALYRPSWILPVNDSDGLYWTHNNAWISFTSICLLSMAIAANALDYLFVAPLKRKSGLFSFSSLCQDATANSGTWWSGFGNGEWFLFFGHNGSRPQDKQIIPTALLDEMAVHDPFEGQQDESTSGVYEVPEEITQDANS
jgi:hypothetical protein